MPKFLIFTVKLFIRLFDYKQNEKIKLSALSQRVSNKTSDRCLKNIQGVKKASQTIIKINKTKN